MKLRTVSLGPSLRIRRRGENTSISGPPKLTSIQEEKGVKNNIGKEILTLLEGGGKHHSEEEGDDGRRIMKE